MISVKLRNRCQRKKGATYKTHWVALVAQLVIQGVKLAVGRTPVAVSVGVEES